MEFLDFSLPYPQIKTVLITSLSLMMIFAGYRIAKTASLSLGSPMPASPDDYLPPTLTQTQRVSLMVRDVQLDKVMRSYKVRRSSELAKQVLAKQAKLKLLESQEILTQRQRIELLKSSAVPTSFVVSQSARVQKIKDSVSAPKIYAQRESVDTFQNDEFDEYSYDDESFEPKGAY